MEQNNQRQLLGRYIVTDPKICHGAEVGSRPAPKLVKPGVKYSHILYNYQITKLTSQPSK
jgi:hypothetical protein